MNTTDSASRDSSSAAIETGVPEPCRHTAVGLLVLRAALFVRVRTYIHHDRDHLVEIRPAARIGRAQP